MYKTIVIGFSPTINIIANEIEEKCNEMLEEGYELITMSITNNLKAVLVFKKN
ncbi:MAG: hypothetical protein Q4C33_03265 [bacterium]|nr:hypothetical protein [bacterium]